jgi:hypothetical protein
MNVEDQGSDVERSSEEMEDEDIIEHANSEKGDSSFEARIGENTEADVNEPSSGESLTFSELERYSGIVAVSLDFKKPDGSDRYVIVHTTVAISWTQEALDQNDLLPNLTKHNCVEFDFEIFGSIAEGLFPNPVRDNGLGSEQNIQIAKEWLEECKHHETCSKSSLFTSRASSTSSGVPAFDPSRRIPKHLIDLSSPGHPRIVAHATLPQTARYVALSYVWGKNQTYTLTTGTYEEKCTSLDLDRLPRTILETIQVTERLGLLYVWVDALCIVQNSKQDMEEEISNMGLIYSKSEVTIIAANSSSATEGFLKTPEAPSYFIKPFEIPFATKDDSTECATLGYRSYYKPLKDPINCRAWTLQERLLSTRSLLYSYDGLKWVCKSGEHNTTSPPEAPPMFPRIISPLSTWIPTNSEFLENLRQMWLEIRSEYTERQLTYGKDKLPAISAIAFEIYRASGWTYLAGLWQEHLFLDIQWQSDTHSAEVNPCLPRPQDYRAPSWSWAAVDGHIVDANEGGDPREPFHCQVLSCEVEYQSTSQGYNNRFHFEPVKSGMLVVEALMIEASWRRADPRDFTDIFLLVKGDDMSPDSIYGEGTFDAQECLSESTSLHCMAMSLLNYQNRKTLPVEGLLLLPVDTGTFRRLGFFRVYSKTMFESVEVRIVRIV